MKHTHVKKLLLSIVTIMMLSSPTTSLIAGSGDTAAGVAAGLIGGAMITGIASQSGRSGRREAREAKREVEELRREQQKEKIADIKEEMHKQIIIQQSTRTTNLLILAIVLLFLGLVGLGIIVARKK